MVSVFLLLELVPLLIPKPFYLDWVNHVWILEYYTQYLIDHATFPPAIHVDGAFGNPMPLFYGILFYPLLAFLSVFTGSDIALRLCFAFLLVVPVVTYFIVFRSILGNNVLAIYLSIVTNFSMYQMTNLYHRGALTEFFAYQLILIGFSLNYYAIFHKRKSSNALLLIGCISLLFAFGAHPITLYNFAIFLFPVIVILLIYYRFLFNNLSIGKLALFSTGMTAILLPWLINVINFKNNFKVGNYKLYYFPTSIDSIFAKIGFFYSDQRVIDDGVLLTHTPYISAPLPVILMLIFCYFIFHFYSTNKINLMKGFIPAGIVLVVMIIAIIPPQNAIASEWPEAFYVFKEHGFLYRLLVPIQFAYRLTGPISILLVIITIFFVHLIAKTILNKVFIEKMHIFVFLASFMVLLSHVQKCSEIYFEYIKTPELVMESSIVIPDHRTEARVLVMNSSEHQSIIKDTSRYPFTFYGSSAYTMPQLYLPRPELAARDEQVIPLLVRDYGQEMRFTCERQCILQTNIVPTTLHRVLIDGREPEKAFLAENTNLDFELAAGSHVIRVDLVGDYVRPIIVSIWLALGLFCLSTVYAMIMIGAGLRARVNRAVG